MARKTIVALYDRAPDADAARTRLRNAGIPDNEVEIVSHSGFGAGSGHGEIVPRMTGWGVPYDEALVYAQGLRDGGVLLVASPSDDASVDRAVSIIQPGPAMPAADTLAPESTGYTVKTTPTATPVGPSSADMSDAIMGSGAAGDADSERSLSDAAAAMRNANAAGGKPTAGAKRKAKAPDVYIDRPDAGGRGS